MTRPGEDHTLIRVKGALYRCRGGGNDTEVSSAGGVRVMVQAQPHFSSLLACPDQQPAPVRT